jgi:epoxide hydrolase-like predicted phosphatase
MIEAVISDFGGVLTTPLAQAFAAIQDEAEIPLDALGRALGALAERHGVNPLFELETGRLSEADFMDGLRGALREQLGREVEIHRFGERYFHHLEPNQALIDYMRSLRDRGYRMAMLTNNVREWEPLWRAMLPVDEIFELVIDSAFVGMRKPEPAIYELTLAQLGLPAPACVFLDDVELNCHAAAALGMPAVHFRATEQAVEEIEELLAGRGGRGPDQLSEPSRSQR